MCICTQHAYRRRRERKRVSRAAISLFTPLRAHAGERDRETYIFSETSRTEAGLVSAATASFLFFLSVSMGSLRLIRLEGLAGKKAVR